ncbi:MAG TPA: hypothetical protein VJL31_17710, partial [Gemmatimonadales bacterium]|nr:hypothetical protein [Gemmatimonadales bacterium]
PRAVLLRQGEGDFRDSVPGNSYLGQPALFLGVVERTVRLSLAGRYQPATYLWLSWDVGSNFTRNLGHSAGVSQSAFEAVGEVGVRLDFPRTGPR